MDAGALIAQVTSRLQLEEEWDRVVLSDNDQLGSSNYLATNWKYCLARRVLTDKPIKFTAFEDMMASA